MAAPMAQDKLLSQRARWAGGEPVATLLMAKALEQPELVSLAAGFTDQKTLPAEPVQKALEAIWANPEDARVALQYGTTIGHRPLREALLQRMVAADGQTAAEMNLSVDRVVITAGSNEMLFLIGDTILDPGDIVLCGSPSYFVFLGTLANLGVRAMGVPIDEDGLIPEALEDTLEQLSREDRLGRVKAIYITSYFDNPSTVTVSAARRAAYIEIAKRFSRYNPIRIIEDTAYRELRYYGDDIPSIRSFDPDGDTVILTGSFSKTFSPGIRVGWGMLPHDLIDPVVRQKGNIDFGSPNFNQHLMHTVLALGLLDDHLETLRQNYRQKIDTALEAADELFGPIDGIGWIRPRGGLYVWLEMPESIDTGLNGVLFDRAVEEGVLYVPGVYCYPTEGPDVPKNRIRLTFGVCSCEEIRRGMEALARAIRGVI